MQPSPRPMIEVDPAMAHPISSVFITHNGGNASLGSDGRTSGIDHRQGADTPPAVMPHPPPQPPPHHLGYGNWQQASPPHGYNGYQAYSSPPQQNNPHYSPTTNHASAEMLAQDTVKELNELYTADSSIHPEYTDLYPVQHSQGQEQYLMPPPPPQEMKGGEDILSKSVHAIYDSCDGTYWEGQQQQQQLQQEQQQPVYQILDVPMNGQRTGDIYAPAPQHNSG